MVSSREAGAELRAARRKKGLTLDAVASELRIPPVQLAALEGGEAGVFAAEVYARGAYVKYARYLGVHRRESYHAFLRSMSGTSSKTALKLPRKVSWLERVWTPAGVIVLAVAAGVMAVTGYLAFQVQSYMHVPRLQLIEPDAKIVHGSRVTVKGWAEKNARVTVNDETVLLDKEGKFSTVIPLKGGINVLQLKAEGASGRTAVLRRDLLVERK